MDTITYSRGILVDSEGYFLAALQWPSDQSPPEVNKRRRTKSVQRHLLRDDYAIENADPRAKWDFKPVIEIDENGGRNVVRTGTWQFPTEVVYLFRESDGAYLGKKTVWPRRWGQPRGVGVTDVAPPSSVARRPLWDAEAGAWTFARVVHLLDADGVVVNSVLENPLAHTDNVEVPPGLERVNADDLPSGVTIGRGARRAKGTDGMSADHWVRE